MNRVNNVLQAFHYFHQAIQKLPISVALTGDKFFQLKMSML